MSLQLPSDWFVRVCDSPHELQLFNITRQNGTNSDMFDLVVVPRTLIVSEQFMWDLSIHGHKVNSSLCPAVVNIPPLLDFDEFKKLVDVVVNCNVCCGHPDQSFIDMAKARKGKFLSVGKDIVATLDTRFSITYKDNVSTCTVRHAKCELLTVGSCVCCKACSGYRVNLRAMYANFSKQKSWSRNINTRYLRTPQKARKLRSLKKALSNKSRQLKRLKAKLQIATETHGVCVDPHDFNDLIEKQNGEIAKLPVYSFKRIFWEQQVIDFLLDCLALLFYLEFRYLP